MMLVFITANISQGKVLIMQILFLYLIFNNVDGYIEESNEDKYLIFASTDKEQKSIRKVHRTLG